MHGLVDSRGILANQIIILLFLINVTPGFVAGDKHFRNRAAEAFSEHVLNGGLAFHELVVRHLGIQPPAAPNFRARLARDMRQFVNL